jgi:monovalent cation:H+ antiporter-2, CPA2 family
MTHLPNLIIDLALILGAAAVITLIFKKLKQPLVLGYIIAGFIVGPYFTLFPTVREVANIRIWAEIGVIFLLFSLGLEFSFKKLIKVGGSASITAIIEVIVMVGAGYGAGQLLGWSTMDSLFLGGILSISSTTIIIRAFDELGMKTRQFAALVFGVLIVEDLVAIVLLVLLSTLSVSQQFAGTEMLFSILKLIFFLVIWFLAGIFVVPTFLRKTKKLMTNEMLLVISLAFCLAMVIFADKVGFSPALGAFIMGSILAETTKAEKIEHLIKPVTDLFGAIFFVSVGMLIDPQVLVDYAGPIALLCLVTIVGKVLSTAMGALLSGQGLQTSIQAGFSLAQIGEFSFIIATLGLTLGVTSSFLYPIAVAVSAVTTLTTPYLIKSSDAFYRWLDRTLPKRLTARLARYSSETKSVAVADEWKVYLRTTAMNIALICVILFSIVIVVSDYLLPWVVQNEALPWLRVAVPFITLLMMLPFLWALSIRNPADVYARIVADKRYQRPLFIVRLFRLILVAFFIGFLLDTFFSFAVGLVATAGIIILLISFSKKIHAFYTRLEERFISNLNQREIAEARTNRRELAPWDAHIVPVAVEPGAACSGKTLLELRWRETAGINVVLIKRGDLQIPVPAKHEQIFPADQLLVLGTDKQVKKLTALIRPDKSVRQMQAEEAEISLQEFVVREGSPLIGRNIREAGFREKANSLVVGIERMGERLLNPESETVFMLNDLVFVVGERSKLESLLRVRVSENP